MSGLISDEIAEDYKSSLEDLVTNDASQIRNLTVIAKENTEYAQAISRVLENHIRSIPPPHKLPALYVVDSIVKNIGSPYTLFLGRNMFPTFMDAYSSVDAMTRKKLDEMLNTWKQPAPGSLDTRPVFPPEITRNIESALIKARTAALQQQQARSQTDLLGRRGNTTPTGWNNGPSQNMSRHPQYSINGHTSTPPVSNRDSDLNYLNRDLDGLIASARNDFANSPFNPACQQRLKALLDLQGILQRQQLTQEQLKLVRDQVSMLAATKPPSPPNATSIGPVAPPQIPAPPVQPVSQPFQNLLNPGTLAELIKATASHAHSSTKQHSTASRTGEPSDRGVKSAWSSTWWFHTPRVFEFNTDSWAYTAVHDAQWHAIYASRSPYSSTSPNGSSGVPMNTASMKIPRLGFIVSLYDSRSNRCGTCGRRFFATEEGKEMKARHLDWHFKTNQRMTEASRRAQTRSWYVDERDWIKSREAGDDNGALDPQATEGAEGIDGNSKQEPPNPGSGLRTMPRSATPHALSVRRMGTRVYHASCYAEVTKDGPAPARGAMPQARTGTPDSVLGKRKAEGNESPGQKTRVKMEQA
ncbi:uncharacterized protein N7446_009876 [Penicillium canescens]|uniref:uncharacterized protein n=1 Tax=Penicillium canescens TaxID=5083 RepID=UPI0026E01EBC|nr:uncharacterized protein N7446_009876 [Penicillium canescens]KAJ6053864.1 hypothetical protein N7446_009876 [Penicillium canescens]